MKKMFFATFLMVCFGFSVFAQSNELIQLQNKVATLENSNLKLNNQIRANQKAITDLSTKLNTANETIVLLENNYAALQQSLNAYSADFNNRITEAEKKTDDQLSSLGKSLSNSTLFWIIAFLVVAAITLLLNWQLKGKFNKERKEIAENIKTGNEQMRGEFAGMMNKSAEDLKYSFSNEIKDATENIYAKANKSLEELRSELSTNFKLANDAFAEKINNLEAKIKNMADEGKKTKDKASL